MNPTFDRALQLLESSSADADPAALILKLKRALPDEDPMALALAVETYVGRRSAQPRLGAWSREGFFSKALLEQASRSVIAAHRARYFSGVEHVLEVGTGSGSDTAALARVVERVTTVDTDPVASELAKRNLELQGVTNVSFVVGDAEQVIPTLEARFDGFFADPARRSASGTRVKEATEYRPSLDYLLELGIGRVRAVKVSPGLFVNVNHGVWRREFIGVDSECLDQTLWFGAGPPDLSACRADLDVMWSPPEQEAETSLAEEIRGYLLEPQAVVNRTGRVASFLAEYGALPVGADVPLGIVEKPVQSGPLCAAFEILESFPFQTRRLKEALSRREWSSRTEFKKRNFPREPDEVRSTVKLPAHVDGAPYGVVFLLRWSGKPWCILCERKVS